MTTKPRPHRAPRVRVPLHNTATSSFSQNTAVTAPDPVWQRLLDGETPLRVWREFRGVSRDALAEELNVEALLIFALERESVPMSEGMRERIGAILGIPAEALVRMADKSANDGR